MSEQPNKPLTPEESLNHVFFKIDRYLARGLCEPCALKLVCADYGINYSRLLKLYLDRDLHG